MKFLLAAINAKYIHSNLGIYSLKAYAGKTLTDTEGMKVEIAEYTINHQQDFILKDIYKRKPEAIGFSCYIWNIKYVMELVHDVAKVLPHTDIWLGGPEVSFNASEILNREKAVKGIMIGEGEKTFSELLEFYMYGMKVLADIHGIAFRNDLGECVENPVSELMDMSQIPFCYENAADFEHRIIYYESSRGCPFSCSYCLSSIDKTVRFRNTELVKSELKIFLDNNVPQVKFVDRTFNCNKKHAMEIWKFITENDNGVTNFHFEISADLLGEEELMLMKTMRPGLIQLEIGVQTTNPDTISEIRRSMDIEKLAKVVGKINGFNNIHQHLDLIAGLPHEDIESFKASFNDVYAMCPEQLQLGFLKVLKGSYMAQKADEYKLVYKSEPPYEVLSTKWLGYDGILKLKAVEEITEVYYNSGQFRNTLAKLQNEFNTPFEMFEALAEYYEGKLLFDRNHNRIARYEILFDFICDKGFENIEKYRDSLMYDLYLRENIKSRPSFASGQDSYKAIKRDFFIKESKTPEYLKGYEEYDSKQISKMAHAEVFSDGRFVVFDYKNRNPLTYNASAHVVCRVQI